MKIRLLSLIILSYPFFVYASCGIKPCDFIQCQPGYHCVNGECTQDQACPPGQCVIGYTDTVPPTPICGKCPPEDPCQGVTCNPGYHCDPKTGKCVSEDPCKDVKCDYLFHCENGTCVKDPTPCPKELAPDAYVYVNNKAYGLGWDSTPRVHGDPEFCYAIHGESVNDCHLEGWPRRADCEYYLMNYNCPTWQFTTDKTNVFLCHDDQGATASCDHFGSVDYRDDPQTPTSGDSLDTLVGFEGEPKVCGLHRDSRGPNQGFFTIAHGKAFIRACVSTSTPGTCGSWKEFNH